MKALRTSQEGTSEDKKNVKPVRGGRTLEKGGNADDDFNRIPKGGIEETGEGLAKFEGELFCSGAKHLSIQ